VKAGTNGSLEKAGVGIGIYYDGRNGYARDWTQAQAEEFVQYVATSGGQGLDVFRLLKDGPDKNDWPYEDWWWTVLADFVDGTTPAPTPAPTPVPTPPTPPTPAPPRGLYQQR
jgi:hypothetical protein